MSEIHSSAIIHPSAIIGDLSLVGVPLRCHIVAIKPGHNANCELAKLILQKGGMLS